MLARVHEVNSIGWEPVTLKKIEIYSFDASRSRVVATCSVRPVECLYEVSTSHLVGNPLEMEVEKVEILERGFKIFNPQEIGGFNMVEIGEIRPD